MLRFLKRLFYFALIVAAAVVFWGVFAIWTGIYSVYSIPPTHAQPDGATLIVQREQGEPTFNSPDYKKPAPPKEEPKGGGLKFGTIKKPPRQLDERTILELPYIEWAYRKSIEPEKPPAGE
jgi:hypothetical protein